MRPVMWKKATLGAEFDGAFYFTLCSNRSQCCDTRSANHRLHDTSGPTTLLQLLLAVRTVVRELGTASDDIEAVIAQIDSFSLAVREIQRFTAAAHLAIPATIHEGISLAVVAFLRTLVRVEKRLASHKGRSLRRLPRAPVWRRLWSYFWDVIVWVFLRRQLDISDLRRQLADQLVVVQTFVTLLHWCATRGLYGFYLANKPSTSSAEVQRVHSDNVAATLRSLCRLNRSVRLLASQLSSYVPFHFFDHDRREIAPLLTFTWNDFVDFWTQHGFDIQLSGLTVGVRHQLFYDCPVPGGKIWFDLYIFANSHTRYFGTTTVVMSPVYFSSGLGEDPRISTALSELFSTSARWLATNTDSQLDRHQFLHLEYGFDDDLRASLHTKECVLYSSTGFSAAGLQLVSGSREVLTPEAVSFVEPKNIMVSELESGRYP
ncbi:hypothetical protein AURDEDRAFT_171741 [Auricularia subglabra TFB-10046 SS5]|nr:hypothetical protein AURDEDRAFT_171741 [Auricularia subglabra TFB-10046 SS5]